MKIYVYFNRVLALEGALSEPCSLNDLRLVCRGHAIPNTMRAQVWHRFLGLSANENGLEKFDEIFDLPNQSTLREDCRILVKKLDNEEEDKLSILSDLESLLTHYCKSHKVSYDSNNGWHNILSSLVSLKLPKNELYAYFSAVIETFIPR